MSAPTLIVIMGVAGSGKSSVGAAAAGRLGLPFVEADDFHPEANRARMAAGQALTDDDRKPWIAALTASLAQSPAPVVILACSALTPSVRDWLRAGFTGTVRYILLSADRAVIGARMAARRGHFAGPDLLENQFAALAPPTTAALVDASRPFETVVDEVCARIEVFASH